MPSNVTSSWKRPATTPQSTDSKALAGIVRAMLVYTLLTLKGVETMLDTTETAYLFFMEGAVCFLVGTLILWVSQ